VDADVAVPNPDIDGGGIEAESVGNATDLASALDWKRRNTALQNFDQTREALTCPVIVALPALHVANLPNLALAASGEELVVEGWVEDLRCFDPLIGGLNDSNEITQAQAARGFLEHGATEKPRRLLGGVFQVPFQDPPSSGNAREGMVAATDYDCLPSLGRCIGFA
jgi:hypothetical protein